MKVTGRFLRTEPYTSAVDHLEDSSHDSFPIGMGKKIARLKQREPFFEVVVEMESDGKVIADWSERISIVVEGKTILDMPTRLYKLTGYARDVTDENMYQYMRNTVSDETGKGNGEIDRIINSMIEHGIVAINAE